MTLKRCLTTISLFSYQKTVNCKGVIERRRLNIDDDSNLPDGIVFPPTNADVTDEDNGDDGNVAVNNLPGSLLKSQAEIVFNKDISNKYVDDSVDNIPLSQFMKYKKRQKPND